MQDFNLPVGLFIRDTNKANQTREFQSLPFLLSTWGEVLISSGPAKGAGRRQQKIKDLKIQKLDK